MNKLKYIRVQEQDNSYSADIPIGADAQNIDMKNNNTLQDTIGNLDVSTDNNITEQLSSLHNDIDSLDNNKLNKSDVNNYVPSVVTSWLNNNVNPVGSAVTIDKSLSIEGSAADAGITGDTINKIFKNGIMGKYYNFNTYEIPANYKDSTIIFFDFTHIFEKGDYWIVSDQSGSANLIDNTGRNMYIIQGYRNQGDSVTTIYGKQMDVGEGISVEKFTIPFDGHWRFGRWIVNNNAAFSISSSMILTHDPKLAYPDDIRKQIDALTTEVFFYGKGMIPDIIWNNTTSKYDVTLPNTNSIRLIIRTNDTDKIVTPGISGFNQAGASFSIAHDNMLVLNLDTGIISVLSTGAFDILSNRYAVLLYNSSGNISGQWSKYYYYEVIRSNLNCVDSLVAPYGNITPTFSISGTSITMFCNRCISFFYDSFGQLISKMPVMDAPMVVPHDSFAVFNYQTETYEVKTSSEIRTSQGRPYIIMFYNTNGRLRGPWEKYYLTEKTPNDIDFYFYGRNSKPNFSIDANGTVTVTITNPARINYNNLDSIPRKTWTGDTHYVVDSGGETYIVPHNSSLVYDYDANTISVVAGAYEYSKNKTLLFYNSQGSINGPWRIYWLQGEMENKSSGSGVPTYYVSHILEKAQIINSHLAESSNNAGFVFITDIHYPSNAMNSVYLVQDICRKTGITYVHLNGDYLNRESTKELALTNIPRIIGKYQYAGIETYATVGNHEWNNPSASNDPEYLAAQLSESELKWCNYSQFRNKATFDSNSLGYYYDDPACKIRYFVGAVGRGTNPMINSIKWIASQLQNVPSGYSVIIIFHTLIHLTNNVPTIVGNATILEEIMNAVHDKTTYTYDGITYDYRNIDYTLICAICGDYHLDINYTTSSGVNIVATTTDSFQQIGDLERQSNTISEQAFDVISINKTARKIYFTRIGAGEDREFSY